MSSWEDWKKSLGESRPWHLIDPDKIIDDKTVIDERMKICNSCEFLTSVTKQCKKCGCVMTLKTKLANAGCPIGKWPKHEG